MTESAQTAAIFVDVQNIYYTVRQAYQAQFNYTAFWKEVSQKGEIVAAYAYAIDRGDPKQRSFQNFLKQSGKGKNYFICEDPEKDLSQVNIKDFEKVDIPNQPVMIENNYFNLDDIRKKYTYLYYLKDIDYTKHQKIELLFEGVAIESDIYLNKKYIGHHESGYTPFEVDITNHIDQTLDQQELLVIVSGEEKTRRLLPMLK